MDRRTFLCGSAASAASMAFGGSLAVSPYRLAERRTIYQHAGPGLATAPVGDYLDPRHRPE